MIRSILLCRFKKHDLGFDILQTVAKLFISNEFRYCNWLKLYCIMKMINHQKSVDYWKKKIPDSRAKSWKSELEREWVRAGMEKRERKSTAFHFVLKPYIMLIITHFWHNRINFNPSTRFIFSAWRPKRTELQDRFQINYVSYKSINFFSPHRGRRRCRVSYILFLYSFFLFMCCCPYGKHIESSTWNSTSVLMMPCVSDVMHIRCSVACFFFLSNFFFNFNSDFHSISIDVNCRIVRAIIIHAF